MEIENNNAKDVLLRFLNGLGLALFSFIMLPAFYLAILLVCLPETFKGFLFGFAVLIFFFVIILLFISFYFKEKRKILITFFVSLALVGILLAACYFLTPDGKNSENSNVKSIFSGTAKYDRSSIANLVPEIDQFKLATYVFPLIDPFIDRVNSTRLRNLCLNIYREMRCSNEFNKLGSVLNLCYLDIFTGTRPTGHIYEYVPKSNQTLPVIIFIHGSLGNFKGYLWCWKKFADKNQFAIIAPTFGAGDWNKEGGVEEILRAVEYCKKNPKFDCSKIYLVGLSNGGKGVSRAILSSSPSSFKGIIYISAIIEDEIIWEDDFIGKCKSQNILVLHGEKDRRIPLKFITPIVDKLAKDGINIKSKYYPSEDHFLMFSDWTGLSKDIRDWLKDTD